MPSWLQIKEHNLQKIIDSAPPIPEDHKVLVLKKPYGKGSYRLKYEEIRRSNNTTLVLAYTRLVSVWGSDLIYMQAIPVEPY